MAESARTEGVGWLHTSGTPVRKARLLKFALGRRSHTRALEASQVSLGGFQVAFEPITEVNRMFRRMVRGLEFDVCEMSFATYLCAREHGVRFVGLPVFLMRGLAHTALVRTLDSDVRGPPDLAYRRVGTHNGYTATTGVWARDVLATEYGVDLSSVIWVRTGDEHVADYRPPQNVTSLSIRAPLVDVVASGELTSAIGATLHHAAIGPLIPDAEQAGLRAARDRGFYPVNHLVVVRSALVDEDPDLAIQLFQAFTEAKRDWLTQLRVGTLVDPTAADTMYRTVMHWLDGDPLPYGLEPNRAMVERLVACALDQGIITSPVNVEELFPAQTLGLAG